MVAYLALFVALGGSAAALQGKNTVRSDDIVNKQVKTQDLAKRAVNGSRLKPNAVGSNKIRPQAVGRNQLAPGAVGPEELADAAVTLGKLAPDAVTGPDVADGSLSGEDLGAGSLGIDRTDGTIPHAAIAERVTDGRLKFSHGLINLIGEGTNNTRVTDTPIGEVLLGCEGSEVGGSLILKSTMDGDAFVVADPGLGLTDPSWALLEPGDEMPATGTFTSRVGEAGHVEFRVFGIESTGGTPRGTVDIWWFHDPATATCYAMWESTLYE